MSTETRNVEVILKLDITGREKFAQLSDDVRKSISTNIGKIAQQDPGGIDESLVRRLNAYRADRESAKSGYQKLALSGDLGTRAKVGAMASEGMSALTSRLGMIGAAVVGVGFVTEAATKVIADGQNQYKSSDQTAREVFRSIPILGSRIQDFTDAITGRGAAMIAAQLAGQREMIQSGGRSDVAASNLQIQPRSAELAGIAEFFRSHSAVTVGPIDRSSAGGEREYAEQVRLQPLRQAAQNAQRTEVGSKREGEEAKRQLASLESRENELTRQRRDLELRSMTGREARAALNPGTSVNQRFLMAISGREVKDTDRPESGPERMHLLAKIEAIDAEIARNKQSQQSAEQKISESTVRIAGATAEREKAEARVSLIAKAERLEDAANKKQSLAQTLGEMNPIERMIAKQNADLGRQFGDWATSDMKAARRQLYGETYTKEIEARGRAAPEFAGIIRERQGSGELPPGAVTSHEDDRIEAMKARKELGEIEYASDTKSATAAASAIEKLGDRMATLIIQACEKVALNAENRIRIANLGH